MKKKHCDDAPANTGKAGEIEKEHKNRKTKQQFGGKRK